MKTFSPMRPPKSNVKTFYPSPKLICIFTTADESPIIVEFRAFGLRIGAMRILDDLSLRSNEGEALAKLKNAISPGEMRRLNYAVNRVIQTARDVAAEWLERKGF